MKYNLSWDASELGDVQAVANIVRNMELDTVNRQRKQDSYLLYDYYHDNQMKYLESKHNELFPSTWRDKMRITINLTKKITDAISTTYTSTVKRELKTQKDKERYFDRLTQSMSTLDKLLYTDRSALLGLHWDADKASPTYRAYPQFLFDMLLDDHKEELQLVAISDWTESFYMLPTGRYTRRVKEEDRRIFVWTKDNYWVFDGQYNVVPQEGNPGNKNKFGFIPFVHVHMDDLHWEDILDPRKALTDSNEMVNIQMSNLQQLGFKQSHAQLWIKMPQDELQLAGVDDASGAFGSVKDASGDSMDFIPVGPESALTIGEDCKYLNIPTNASELINMIVFTLNTVAGSFGLEDAAFSIKGDEYSSGIKMAIKKEVLNKMRHERRQYFASLERRVYNMIRDMARKFSGVNLPEDAFVIEFIERPARIETSEALSQSITMLKEAGVYNQVQAIHELHPELTREEAKELVKTMSEENEELGLNQEIQDGSNEGTVGPASGNGSSSSTPQKAGRNRGSVPQTSSRQ